MSVHLVNLLLVNLMDREPLELEAWAELAPGHGELSDWSIVTMKASDWSNCTHRGHVLLGLELGKVEARREHEYVGHGEQPLEEGEADLEREALGGLQHVHLVIGRGRAGQKWQQALK